MSVYFRTLFLSCEVCTHTYYKSKKSRLPLSVDRTQASVIFNECRGTLVEVDRWKHWRAGRWWMSRAPIKRFELAAISRPAATPGQPSPHFRRVNFNNSILPSALYTIHLRAARWLARFFRRAFNYPKGSRSHKSEHCLAKYRSLERSLFLSFWTIVALATV